MSNDNSKNKPADMTGFKKPSPLDELNASNSKNDVFADTRASLNATIEAVSTPKPVTASKEVKAVEPAAEITRVAELSDKLRKSEEYIEATRQPGGNKLGGRAEEIAARKTLNEYQDAIFANAGVDPSASKPSQFAASERQTRTAGNEQKNNQLDPRNLSASTVSLLSETERKKLAELNGAADDYRKEAGNDRLNARERERMGLLAQEKDDQARSFLKTALKDDKPMEDSAGATKKQLAQLTAEERKTYAELSANAQAAREAMLSDKAKLQDPSMLERRAELAERKAESFLQAKLNDDYVPGKASTVAAAKPATPAFTAQERDSILASATEQSRAALNASNIVAITRGQPDSDSEILARNIANSPALAELAGKFDPAKMSKDELQDTLNKIAQVPDTVAFNGKTYSLQEAQQMQAAAIPKDLELAAQASIAKFEQAGLKPALLANPSGGYLVADANTLQATQEMLANQLADKPGNVNLVDLQAKQSLAMDAKQDPQLLAASVLMLAQQSGVALEDLAVSKDKDNLNIVAAKDRSAALQVASELVAPKEPEFTPAERKELAATAMVKSVESALVAEGKLDGKAPTVYKSADGFIYDSNTVKIVEALVNGQLKDAGKDNEKLIGREAMVVTEQILRGADNPTRGVLTSDGASALSPELLKALSQQVMADSSKYEQATKSLPEQTAKAAEAPQQAPKAPAAEQVAVKPETPTPVAEKAAEQVATATPVQQLASISPKALDNGREMGMDYNR